jgi:hypothetical protein
MTGGGVAAMGLQIGHLIAINVDATNGIEVRQARNIAGEVVTLCRDLSANPGAGKAVYGGTQYWPDKTIMTPWRDYQYIDGNNHRYALGGIAVSDFELSADWGGETTEVQEKFSGRGAQLVALATSIPTPPTLAGIPLVTNQGKVWIGSIKGCINKVTLKSNNGMELEENESCGPYPSGIKRTGNDGKYLIELEIDYVLEAQTHFDGVPSLTSYDTLVQLGDQAGNIIAFVCRKWVPIDVQKDDLDGQVGQFLKGRALATVDEDEIFLALL